MTNYFYNGMNAHDIASRIIEGEMAYDRADFGEMTFDEKCRYVMDQTPAKHPVVAFGRDRSLFNMIRKELVERGEGGDAYAFYVLGNVEEAWAFERAEKRRFLERAMEEGYFSAALTLMERLDRFYHGKSYSEPASQRIGAWVSERASSVTDVEDLYRYYELTDDKDKLRVVARALAREGDWRAINRLAYGVDLDLPREERVFWLTVEFLVIDDLYKKGIQHLGPALRLKRIHESGCDYDGDEISHLPERLIGDDEELLCAIFGDAAV